MKIKYNFIVSMFLVFFISFFNCHSAFSATASDMTFGVGLEANKTKMFDSTYYDNYANRFLAYAKFADGGIVYYYCWSNAPIKLTTLSDTSASAWSILGSTTGSYRYGELDVTLSGSTLNYYFSGNSLSNGNLGISLGAKPVEVKYVKLGGTVTFNGASVADGSSVVGGIISPVFDSADISAYPVGTVKIVQPKTGAKFDSGVSTAIDVEVWGKIPITINDSTWFGLGEETWLKNALSAPITNNSAIYINGVKDMIGTGVGINSASLGDSYGLTILGDLKDWKQTGYYCFKYKFTYSPLNKDSITKITYGVSPVTSWKTNTFIDDYGYTYYSDTIDLKVANFIDYNNDNKDDVTGEDLTGLNDNSSSIPLDPNASIAETMEYYTNKFYDAITGVIKTPFNMLESALKLGDTYLIKLTNLLEPVTQNFKQLLSFIPDDIMTCIWAIISCRLIWTAIRSFIAMLTKR